MSDGVEKVIEAVGVFIIVAIAGWMMRDIEIAKPLGTWWFILGVLGVAAIVAALLSKLLGEV
ncbi:hypothetical protein [Thermococcus barophilus]|uniref:Uncharacterized protein n=1 Tax=Thermococcus barophilus TaxID=55802 RepID=A0A0S1X8C3_THEBA|nr:hypothetical protein [Thermococcus barophilus]ALM74008.1 hypothetical protein TBCH5v1_0028 [Thermococcus barophilus]